MKTDTVVVGAGPYGLSIASHLRATGVSFRIFGRPMEGWRTHMPKGMLLKSDGFASNLADPDGHFTLAQFCSERGIEYSDTEIPVSLDTFINYGLEFQKHLVPGVEEKSVISLTKSHNLFNIVMSDGEIILSQRVVLATGLRYYAHIPATLVHLSSDYLSHSDDHHDLEPFRGRRVVVVGGGASAVDLAGLLFDVGAEVQLIARQPILRFHGAPAAESHKSLYRQIRHPKSGIGPGWRSRIYTEAPMLFHQLPQGLRLLIVRTHLRPAGGWFAKDKIIGRVPLLLGHALYRAELQNGSVHLLLQTPDGHEHEIVAEHIISATGYRVNTDRLEFLSPELQSRLKTIHNTPILSRNFESSVPGLYFTGIAAANSFGPMMRFVFGAKFSAGRIAAAIASSSSLERPPYIVGA
jgi:thioredoxin reductase